MQRDNNEHASMNSEPINWISVKHYPICETTLIESFKNFLIAESERGEVQRWQQSEQVHLSSIQQLLQKGLGTHVELHLSWCQEQ